jgi:protein SCO1/2
MRFGLSGLGVIGIIVGGTLVASPSVLAQVVGEKTDAPPQEGRYLYRPVPDILVRGVPDRSFRLSDVWRERPILLVLVFTRCSGVCSPLLRSLRAAAASVGGAGREYVILVLSFDPRDTLADMAELAEHVGVSGEGAWTFGVASAEDIARVVRATGFWFEWDAASRQYDHPAMVIGVRDGRIVRFLVGGTVAPVRLQEVIREMRGEFVPAYPLARNVLFRCFQYDPASGRWTLDWGFLLLLIPGMATLGGTLWIFRREQRHRLERTVRDREGARGPEAGVG